MVLIYGISFSQSNNFPTKEKAKLELDNSKWLTEEISKLMGVPYKDLKVEHDGWLGYKGTGFSLTRTDCGKNKYGLGYKWPADAAYAKYVISGEKDKEGVYKVMGVYLFYKKSSQNNGECILEDTWRFWDYKIEKPIEYGYYEFKKEEAKTLLLDYLKTGKATELNDFVEISSIDFDYFSQSSESAGSHFLSWYFKGKKAHYTLDKTTVLGLEDFSRVKLKIKVEKVDGKWTATNFGIYDQYGKPYSSSFYVEEVEELPYYTNYEQGGWDAIYPKMTEGEKRTGDMEKLQESVKNYLEVLVSKGNELTYQDVSPFISEANSSNFESWFDENFTNAERRYVFQKYELKNVYPVLFDEESLLYVGFPEISAKTIKLKKKNKRKWEQEDRCSDCNKSSSSSLSTTIHSMVWKWEDGNWFLENPESLFLMSEKKWDYQD